MGYKQFPDRKSRDIKLPVTVGVASLQMEFSYLTRPLDQARQNNISSLFSTVICPWANDALYTQSFLEI